MENQDVFLTMQNQDLQNAEHPKEFIQQLPKQKAKQVWTVVLLGFFLTEGMVALLTHFWVFILFGSFFSRGMIKLLERISDRILSTDWLYFSFYMLIMVLSSFLLMRISRIPFRNYGLTLRNWPLSVGLWLGVCLLGFPLYGLFIYLYLKWQPNEVFQRLLSNPLHFKIPPHFLKSIIFHLVLVSIPEELLFRGYIQTRFLSIYKPIIAILLSSLLFALSHILGGNHPGYLLTFFPGLLFGWLAYRTKSLFPSILFHTSCNLLGDCLNYSLFGEIRFLL